jgi:molybdate transport system permease protein
MMDWTAVWLTVRLATCASLILFVAGVPFAYWLSTTRWRGRFVLEAVVALPLVLPPTVVGFYLLMAMGPRSPLGQLFEGLTAHRLPFSFAGILVGAVVCNIPFAIRPFLAAFAGVDRRLVEASWCLGVTRLATFCRVTLPLAWPGILAGVVLAFAHTVGEFGVVLMIGGNIEGVTRTLSLTIYDDLQVLDYASAGRTAAVLLGFAFTVLGVVQALQRRAWPA